MRAALLAMAFLLAACTPARREVDGNVVRDIAFVGNEGGLSGHNDFQLRSQMKQEESRFGLLVWPLVYTVDPKQFVPTELARDAYRLEVWYAHHGWFDAQVRGWEIRRIRDATDKRAGVVDVIGFVEPGPRSVVRRITVEGMGSGLEGIRGAVLRAADIGEGDPFDLEALERLRQSMVDVLHDRARAYATAELELDAHPGQEYVDVLVRVDPGPVARFGEITVSGTQDVAERFVRQKLRIEEGDPYSLQAIRDAQRRVFELGTFAIVTVEPDLSDPTRDRVPLSVRVTESKFRTLRIGAGGTYDSFLPQVRVSSRLTDVHLAHQLLRAELGLRGGVAFNLNATEGPPTIPVWGADVKLAYPRLWRQRGALELTGQVEQDVFGGLWAFQRPSADLDLVYRYGDRDNVQLRVGPHIERYMFLNQYLGNDQQIRNAQLRIFGVEDQEGFSYQLQSFDQNIIWDWRDDPFRTTRGSYYSLDFRQSLRVAGAGYGFLRFGAEGRWYTSPRGRGRRVSPVTLAGRLRGTVIQTLGDTEVVPLPERAYLGGATSIRGFRPNQVGPYVTLITEDETGETRYHLPDGGTLTTDTSVEVRYQMDSARIVAAFFDTGFLADDLQQLLDEQLAQLRWSAGVGFRYDTLVGPFRFDLSFRPLYPEDFGPRRYTGCAECEEIPRAQDFFGNFQSLRGDRHPPFAMVLFLTIGESI